MGRVTPRRLAQALARRRKRAGVLAARRAALAPHYTFRGHGRRRLNVTVVLRNATKPTSSTFIRLYSPLSTSAFGPVGLDVVDEKGLWVSPRTDVCIVQRTAFSSPASARRFLAQARSRGALVAVDSDDAFAALDPDHPQHDLQVERAAILQQVMDEADEVWLSTDELLSTHPGATSRTIRNTLDLDLWKPGEVVSPGPAEGAPLRILYMGTTTHDGDFALVEPVLERLHAQHPGAFTVVTVGIARGLSDRPWMQVLKPDDGAYPRFVPWLSSQGPFDIGLSPLVDSPFNRAKSDIKCLDYLALGALPVVSDVLPYQVDDLDGHVRRVPNDAASWFDTLARMVVDRDRLRLEAPARRTAATRYLTSTRSAEVTGALLRARIEQLRGSSRHPAPLAAPTERHDT